MSRTEIRTSLCDSSWQQDKPFHRHHFQDSNGILWFELQRELESIYYQRIDFVDVLSACFLAKHLEPWSCNQGKTATKQNKGACWTGRYRKCQVQMYHPLAWGFPDSSKIVTPNPGEPPGAQGGVTGSPSARSRQHQRFEIVEMIFPYGNDVSQYLAPSWFILDTKPGCIED